MSNPDDRAAGYTRWWCKHCARHLEWNGSKRTDTVTATPHPAGEPVKGRLSLIHDSCGGVAALTKNCKRSVTEG